MNLRLLTTPWQSALGAMFRAGLGGSAGLWWLRLLCLDSD